MIVRHVAVMVAAFSIFIISQAPAMAETQVASFLRQNSARNAPMTPLQNTQTAQTCGPQGCCSRRPQCQCETVGGRTYPCTVR
jgi:hypothetical protein